jgi:molybdopterin synthase sulfur carrier subunit
MEVLMELDFFATLREITGRSEQQWNSNVETAGALLLELCSRYGPKFKSWVLKENGSLGEMCIILVNGHDIRELDGLATRLHPEDAISFFPPVAGG